MELIIKEVKSNAEQPQKERGNNNNNLLSYECQFSHSYPRVTMTSLTRLFFIVVNETRSPM